MKFSQWLSTFVDEKGTDLEHMFEVEGPSGPNFMTYGVVVQAMHDAPAHEQAKIKNVMVKLDFANRPIEGFLEHLGQALAR